MTIGLTYKLDMHPRNIDLLVKGCPWYIAEGNAVITKEETTCIGNAVVGHPVDGNSGESPNQFNVERGLK